MKNGHLAVTLPSGETGLKDGAKFVGFNGEASHPTAILLKNHNLHAELVINPQNPIGKDDAAGVADIVLESAISTIMDCEDSVAAVDAQDKVEVYRNWLGLMNGTLSAPVEKNGKVFKRKLNPDRAYTAPDGKGSADAARPFADAGAQCRPPYADRYRCSTRTARKCRRPCWMRCSPR